MKVNTLGNLNAYLFEQVERLNNDKLKGEELKEEVGRSLAIESVAKTIIQNANLVLQARKFADDKWDADAELPKMLEGDM